MGLSSGTISSVKSALTIESLSAEQCQAIEPAILASLAIELVVDVAQVSILGYRPAQRRLGAAPPRRLAATVVEFLVDAPDADFVLGRVEAAARDPARVLAELKSQVRLQGLNVDLDALSVRVSTPEVLQYCLASEGLVSACGRGLVGESCRLRCPSGAASATCGLGGWSSAACPESESQGPSPFLGLLGLLLPACALAWFCRPGRRYEQHDDVPPSPREDGAKGDFGANGSLSACPDGRPTTSADEPWEDIGASIDAAEAPPALARGQAQSGAALSAASFASLLRSSKEQHACLKPAGSFWDRKKPEAAEDWWSEASQSDEEWPELDDAQPTMDLTDGGGQGLDDDEAEGPAGARPTAVRRQSMRDQLLRTSKNVADAEPRLDGTAGPMEVVAGGREPGFTPLRAPTGVCKLHVGFLVAETQGHRVLRFVTGPAGEVVGGGEGPGARLDLLNEPADLAATDDGFLVVDRGNDRVLELRDGSVKARVVAGSAERLQLGKAQGRDSVLASLDLGLDKLGRPGGVSACDDGSFLVADTHNHRVLRFVPGSKAGTVVAGDPRASGSALSQLFKPCGVAALPDGVFLVADTGNHRVLRFEFGSADGTVVAGSEGCGSGPLELCTPSAVCVTDDGFLVADTDNHRVLLFSWPEDTDEALSPMGTVVAGGRGKGDGPGQLASPRGVAAVPGGALIADTSNDRVVHVKFARKRSTITSF